MIAYYLILFAHAGLGVAALLTYWIAALAKKGSAPHKLAGKIYVLAMVGLLVPALPLTLRIAVEKSPSFGAFLGYLGILTGTAVWQGWFAIRHKRDFARYTGRGYRGLAALNIVAALATLVLGLAIANPIFIGFAAVGVLGGTSMLRLAKSGPASPRWWLQEHLGAMLACGVATHIAFLSIGLPRLLPMLAGPTLHNIAWLGPLAGAIIARYWLSRKYLGGSSAPVKSNAQPA
jgi:uncharacterized membrane protein